MGVSWIVTVGCTVIKEVVCIGCTEEQARDNPFDHAEEEREIEQTDWTVLEVQPND